MAKRAMSFKPTSECEVQLAGLMDRWGCDRTAALVKSVAISFHWVPRDDAFGGDPKVVRQQLDAEFQSSSPKVLPKDPKEVAKVVAPSGPTALQVGVSSDRPTAVEIADTRSQQQKTDDFYRNVMAKGGKK